MFNTIKDIDNIPNWFVNFLIDFKTNMDTKRIKKFGSTFIREKYSDAELEGLGLYKEENNTLYLIVKRSTFEDPAFPEVEITLYKTILD